MPACGRPESIRNRPKIAAVFRIIRRQVHGLAIVLHGAARIGFGIVLDRHRHHVVVLGLRGLISEGDSDVPAGLGEVAAAEVDLGEVNLGLFGDVGLDLTQTDQLAQDVQGFQVAPLPQVMLSECECLFGRGGASCSPWGCLRAELPRDFPVRGSRHSSHEKATCKSNRR